MNKDKALFLLNIQGPLNLKTLKKQYHKACLKYHPDKNKNSTNYIEIKDAYEFLLEDLHKVSPLFYIDEDYTHNLYILLKNYIVDPLEQHMSSYMIYELNPSLENLMNKEVYYLKDYDLYIPLWHHELYYEEQKIKIKIKPIVEKYMSIDIYNHIHIYLDVKTKKIGDSIFLTIGNKKFNFIYEEKDIVLYEKGIPMIQEKIFDYTLSNIYIHLS